MRQRRGLAVDNRAAMRKCSDPDDNLTPLGLAQTTLAVVTPLAETTPLAEITPLAHNKEQT